MDSSSRRLITESENNSCEVSGLQASSSSDTDETKPKLSGWELVRSIFRLDRKNKREQNLISRNIETQTDSELFDDDIDSQRNADNCAQGAYSCNKCQQTENSRVINGLLICIESLQKKTKFQSRGIQVLASKYIDKNIRISNSSNVCINSIDDETAESISCLENTMKNLHDKSSKMEELLHKLKENIDSLDIHRQQDGKSENKELEHLKVLASKIDTLTQDGGQVLSSDAYSQTCDARHIDDKEDVHCWLPGKEFRKLIRSQSEQSLAQHGLMEKQIDINDVVLDNNRLLKDILTIIAPQTSFNQ